MKIIILAPYPHGKAPSQRFRFEQYLDFLKDNNHSIVQESFLNEKTWNILYKEGHKTLKITGIIRGFLKRFLLLFSIRKYDFVFIHREATPIGPPIIEWVIAKLLKKKIIYDFDDAIWLPNTSKENSLVASLKFHSKTKFISKWSAKISCGNNYLKEYASNYNKNIFLIPTTIDTSYHYCTNKKDNSLIPIIGWTGTHSTEKYLSFLIPILENLEKSFNFRFQVISNHNPQLLLKSFEYIPWNKHSEIKDLSQFDIGVMPLENNKWAEGKCGFKGLQYMALGIPTIMSPVGVNKDIINHGINGLLANSLKEWEDALTSLLITPDRRISLGGNGIKTVNDKYSVEANKEMYLSLFQ